MELKTESPNSDSFFWDTCATEWAYVGWVFWKECQTKAEISTGTAEFSSKRMALFPSAQGPTLKADISGVDSSKRGGQTVENPYWQL